MILLNLFTHLWQPYWTTAQQLTIWYSKQSPSQTPICPEVCCPPTYQYLINWSHHPSPPWPSLAPGKIQDRKIQNSTHYLQDPQQPCSNLPLGPPPPAHPNSTAEIGWCQPPTGPQNQAPNLEWQGVLSRTPHSLELITTQHLKCPHTAIFQKGPQNPSLQTCLPPLHVFILFIF